MTPLGAGSAVDPPTAAAFVPWLFTGPPVGLVLDLAEAWCVDNAPGLVTGSGAPTPVVRPDAGSGEVGGVSRPSVDGPLVPWCWQPVQHAPVVAQPRSLGMTLMQALKV